MKNNLIRLLSVAFAVAVVSTALFYYFVVAKMAPGEGAGRSTLVAARAIAAGAVIGAADVKLAPLPRSAALEGALASPSQAVGRYALAAMEAGQPVTASLVAPADSPAAAAVRIPPGMRAVSVLAEDSAGVVALLRPGRRVDVYAVEEQAQARGSFQLRTVLENMEVLAIAEGDGNRSRSGAHVVTLLARPEEAERAALADAAGRIRLALRNPEDHAPAPARNAAPKRAAAAPAAAPRPAPPPPANPHSPPPSQSVLLRVRLVGADPSAIEEFTPKLSVPRQPGAMQVSAFRPGADIDAVLERLIEGQRAQLLSAARLSPAGDREVSIDTAAENPGTERSCSLRIAFAAARERGRLRLRVIPELRVPSRGGESVRRIATDVELREGQSCLLTGLLPASETGLLGWLFPGWKTNGPRDLMVIVTPEATVPVQTAAAR